MKGIIIKATGSWYQVKTESKGVVACRLPGKLRLSKEEALHPASVGDRVEISIGKDQYGRIEKIEERKNRLIRKATHGRRGAQLMAVNVDQAIIVQSFKKPAFKTGFIDRLLVSCEAFDIKPLIFLNKTDLCSSDKDFNQVKRIEKIYTSIGYSFLSGNIFDTQSMEALRDSVSQKISVFTGPSGTGKTSLLNTLCPGLDLKIQEVSQFSNKGKHTTTFTQLIEIADNTYVIDTPGIREYGLVEIEPFEVSLYFPEMIDIRNRCRFYNCTHRHEPDCAIKSAVEENIIADSRYRSCVNITNSLEMKQGI